MRNQRIIAPMLLVLAIGPALAADELPTVPPGELAGIVTDEDGKPLEGVLVDVWSWHPGNETRTDKDGRYHLKDLDVRGKVEIRFSHEGFDPFYNPQQETGLSSFNVRLSNRTYLEGQVLAPDGNPVPNAIIRADNGPKEGPGVRLTHLWTETKANQGGSYRLYLAPDKYDIQVRVPGVGVYRDQTTVRESEARATNIQLEKGITFIALLTDAQSGAAVGGAKFASRDQTDISGTSDANGKLVISDVLPGVMTFEVDAPGYSQWWSPESAIESQRQLQERRSFDSLNFQMARDMLPVTVHLRKSVTITGHVVDPDGKPVAGATVAPAATGTGNSITGDTRFSVESDANGQFKMTLPAGGSSQQNLVAHDGKYGPARSFANGVAEPMQTQPGDQKLDVILTLTRGATVKGRVTDAAGVGLADREIRAISADGLDNRYYVPTTRTSSDGTYELKLIRPAEQMIQTSPFFLNPSQARAGTSQTVRVEPGETKEGVDLVGR